MKAYADELAASDTKMKYDIMGEALFSNAFSMMTTIVPVADTVTACIELYESLIKGEMLKPIRVTKVKEGLNEVHVFPQHAFAYTDTMTAHRLSCCPEMSRTRRTARSRTSGEYLFAVLLMMLHPTQDLEPPANPVRFKVILLSS